MGEIGVAVVVPRDPRTAPTLAELRDFAAARARGVQAPRGRARRRRAAAHREARRSTGARCVRRRSRRPQLNSLTRTSWNSTSPPTRKNCATRSDAVLVKESAGLARPRGRRTRRRRPDALWAHHRGARMARAHRPGRRRRHRARPDRSRDPRRGARAGVHRCPGRCSPTVTQFVPAVRETATPRNGRGGSAAVATGECSRHARDPGAGRRRTMPRPPRRDCRPTATDVVLTGEKRYRDRRRRRRRARRRRPRRRTACDDGVRAVVVPAAAVSVHPGARARPQPPLGRTSTSTACASPPTACSVTARRRPPRCAARSRRPRSRSRSRWSGPRRRSST